MSAFDETNVRRQPQGVTSGGQFATKPKGETGVTLPKPIDPVRAYGGHFLTPAGQAELAAAVHERTGWDVVVPASGTSAWIGVRTPNGRVLGVGGVDSEFTWTHRGHDHGDGRPVGTVNVVDVAVAHERFESPTSEPVPSRAFEVADALLAKHADALGDVSGRIDDVDEETYTNGLCYQLAREMHEQTGWPIVAVGGSPRGSVGWVHVGVRRPDGKVVDVRGAHDESEWVDQWAEWVDVYGEDEDDYDGDETWVYDLDEYGTAQVPADPYEGVAPADCERTSRVSQLLLAEHS